ncbi:MAG: RidA family protein [Dongiaceae bacterium]
MHDIAQRLKELNIALPTPAGAVANYVGYSISGKNIFISGQLPMDQGKPQFIGKLGKEFSIEQGQQAARLCAINVLAQLQAALHGEWFKLAACVKLTGFINCPDNFIDQSKVMNGASDLMVEVLGDQGRHARAAVGVSSLPLGVAVEVEGIFSLR